MSAEDATITHPDMRAAKAALHRMGLLERERGLDDELDPETWGALFAYAESNQIEWSIDAFEAEDGVIPQAVLDALLDPAGSGPVADDADEELVFDDYTDDDVSFSLGPDGDLDLSQVEVFDLRDQHELQKGRKNPRAVEQITTIMLHQTGIKFGTTSSARARYGERVALHRRFYNVACHAAALMNGDVLLVNDWPRYVYHGNSGNRFSIGVEIEGLYAGIEGDVTTVSGKGSKPFQTLSSSTTAAARRAVQLAVEQGRALGCPITQISAHRCFVNSRISDPGQEIWREVGLWASRSLELTINYDLVREDGRKIPRDWDPTGSVNYRGRDLD